ncbi:hypothetical protein BRADI_1g65295v3 [Brachypodium distachyon]|uniref:Uncharacterized protein n=1 Tax=Brachypodium distachyon TaxID=15368 RepID=A0A2K2DTG7_BRADI|nr:hypothetical protein BRADI_1g65295v3 [Brachypodium distachyon]
METLLFNQISCPLNTLLVTPVTCEHFKKQSWRTKMLRYELFCSCSHSSSEVLPPSIYIRPLNNFGYQGEET